MELSLSIVRRRAKALMAFAIAFTGHCDGCISYHVNDALKAGAQRNEVVETACKDMKDRAEKGWHDMSKAIEKVASRFK